MNFEISELLTVDLFLFGFTLRLCLDTDTNQTADKKGIFIFWNESYIFESLMQFKTNKNKKSYIFDNVCLYEFQVYELFMSYYKS